MHESAYFVMDIQEKKQKINSNFLKILLKLKYFYSPNIHKLIEKAQNSLSGRFNIYNNK